MQFRKSTLANSVKLAADACALATHGRKMVAFFFFFFNSTSVERCSTFRCRMGILVDTGLHVLNV